jgi:hypothetical protein
MSRKEETVFPSEILAAIAYAKKQDAADKFGDKAFQMELTPRDGNNGTRWLSLKILKNRGGKWEYIPLKLKVQNLKTTGNIKTDEQKKETKMDYPGITLSFNSESAFSRTERTAGKAREVVERYGDAKLAISKAFTRLMSAGLKSGAVYNENQVVKPNVQTTRWINKAKGEKETLEKAIIRVKIPFDSDDQKISKGAIPKIILYDADKPRVAEPGKKLVGVPFEHAVDDEGAPLNYTTIRAFIRCGSATSFIDDMSGVCLSSQGASNPSKVDGFLIVKKSRGNKIQADDAYDQDEFAAMAGAETGNDVDPGAEGGDTETAANTTQANPADFDDVDVDEAAADAPADDAEETPEPEPEPVKKAPRPPLPRKRPRQRSQPLRSPQATRTSMN